MFLNISQWFFSCSCYNDCSGDLIFFFVFQALENKLASCRNFVKDPPRGSNPRSGNSPPVNSPR